MNQRLLDSFFGLLLASASFFAGSQFATVDVASSIGAHQVISVGDDPRDVGRKLAANSQRAWLATWVERSKQIKAGEFANSLDAAKSFRPTLDAYLAEEWRDFTTYSTEFAKTEPTIDEHYAWERELFSGYLGGDVE